MSASEPAGRKSGGDRVLLAGCGRMGGALLSGWLKADHIDMVDVVEPEGASEPEDSRVTVHKSVESAKGPYDAVVLAMKPQAMPEALEAYKRFVGASTMFLSIAAGRTLQFLADQLGEDARVVRAMPNSPAAIGAGVSVVVASPQVTMAQCALATRLMNAGGAVEWVDDEGLIDAVTAVSGSGPAYVFLMIEALAEAGVKAGLPADLSMRLARATVSGAGALAAAAEEEAAVLRRNVTSPGGTTEAALEVLMGKDGLAPLMERAVAAAVKRSRDLQ